MTDWRRSVSSWHARSREDDGCVLVTGPPAMKESLTQLEVQLGLKLPDEFRSLYGAFDGIGISHGGQPEYVDWFLMPCQTIPEFCAEIRDWFKQTHEAYAKRFFPFADFGNGDGIGYYVDDTGHVLDGLFAFQHELYEFDEDQDVNEFVLQLPWSIEEFLAET